MSYVAPVKDGKIVETASQNSLKNTSKTNSSGMDKEAFLQLLVAQMQYQDPLEPTSNTEYISQYAQFSQVEQIQNMAASTDLARASSLVGKEVYIKTVDSSGDAKYVRGKVDYVVFENGKAKLSIEEELYSLDDLDTIVDKEYQVAFDKAYDLDVRLNKLPVLGGVDMSDVKEIDELEKIYNEMSDYEKGFVAEDNVKKLNKYVEKAAEVRKKYEETVTKDIAGRLEKLPDPENVTVDNAKEIDSLSTLYNNLSEDGKGLLSEENTAKLNACVERLEELRREGGKTEDETDENGTDEG